MSQFNHFKNLSQPPIVNGMSLKVLSFLCERGIKGDFENSDKGDIYGR